MQRRHDASCCLSVTDFGRRDFSLSSHTLFFLFLSSSSSSRLFTSWVHLDIMLRNAISTAARPALHAVSPSFNRNTSHISYLYIYISTFAYNQRTATTLSAGFPKVTQRVRSRCHVFHLDIRCSLQLHNDLVTYQVRWRLHRTSFAFIPVKKYRHLIHTYISSQVTLIPGDGIGNEITDSVKEIFEYVNAPIEWEQYNVSGMSSSGEELFTQAMESLRRNRVGLKGILFTPISQSGHISWNVAMRQQLDIYASVVLCKSLPGFPTRHNNVDFAIIRENTEGEYSGLEHQSYPGVVESLKVSTRAKAERIIRFAFDFALKNNRKVSIIPLGVL